MSFVSRPDWRQPMLIGERVAYAAFDQPGKFRLPPVRLAAQAQGDESPLRLDIVQQDRGAAGLERYSILSMAFAAEFALDSARQAAFDAAQRVDLSPLPVEGGWLRLSAVQALNLPPSLGQLLPLDAATLGAMNLAVRLDSAATDLFVSALQRGLLAVGAQAWLRVRGVADRLPLNMSFDPSALLAAIRALTGGAASIDHALLRQRLIEAPQTLGLGLPASSGDLLKEPLADAVIDRIAARFAAPQPSAADAPTGVRLVFDEAAMKSGRVQWNLAEPQLAPRLIAIEADPLGPLRTMPAAGLHDAVVRRHDVRALASGWRSLTVRPNLPDRRIGVVSAQVEVQLPAKPPARMFTIKASAPLAASDRPITVDLRLSPSEALNYQWQTSAILLNDGRAETIKGVPQKSDSENLLIQAEDFGLRFVPVEAEPTFLDQADIEVECSGTRKGKPWSARGKLDRAMPDLAFAVPNDVETATIRATACSKGDGTRRAMGAVEADSLRLDAFSFEGSGSRELELSCEFDDTATLRIIELAPEDAIDDAARRGQVKFTRNFSKANWSWLALSPFRSGYRWRWYENGPTPRPWSPVLQPDTPLRLRSSQFAQTKNTTTTGAGAMNTDKDTAGAAEQGGGTQQAFEEIQGVLIARAGEAASWQYRPRAPGIAPGSDGRVQFTLVGAGPVTMLALTAMWGVPSATLDSIRAVLAGRANLPVAQVSLTQAPVEIGEVRLMLGDGKGEYVELAKTRSSGVAPYHAAFNLVLDKTQAEKVRKAMEGERGWLELRYAVTDAASARRASSHQSSESVDVDVSLSTGGESASAKASVRSEVGVEAASGYQQAKTQSYSADAADWGLPKP